MRFSLKPPDRLLMTQLETERFILRPCGALEILRDPGGWRTNRNIYRNVYFRAKPMDLGSWLKRGPFPDGHRRFTFAIVPKGTGTVIGYHLVRRQGWKTAGNTVGIHDPAWLGKDAAVEVRIKLMNHFFRHGEIDRFTSRIEATNYPSIFTYRKLGYRHVGTLHRERADPETGKPVDYLLFEMLKDDWVRGPHAEPNL